MDAWVDAIQKVKEVQANKVPPASDLVATLRLIIIIIIIIIIKKKGVEEPAGGDQKRRGGFLWSLRHLQHQVPRPPSQMV